MKEQPVHRKRVVRVHLVLRAVLLALCGGVSAAGPAPWPDLLWLVPLAAVGVAASLRRSNRSWLLAVTTLEGLVAGGAVVTTGFGSSAFLPYLLAPAFSGGLLGGFVGGVAPVGAASLSLLLAPLVLPYAPSAVELSSITAQWVVLSVFVATVATWVRSLLLTADGRPAGEAAQIEALRLLTELRNVARQLPGTLDPTTTGETILERTRALCRYDVGGVLVASGGGSTLRLAARAGAERPDWNLSLSADSALADAWMTQQAQARGERVLRTGSHPGAGSSLVVPLVSGVRSIGLVVLESSVAQSFSRDTGEQVRAEVDKLVLQLQTGMIFDEIRELATNEERRRLAREIHDGIAQELAYLGYALDNVAHDLSDGRHAAGAASQIDGLRTEVRRLVSELRMSLFDLRADVDPSEGLGAAIGRHVRAVGAASGMTVHLSLNESPLRLSAETEAELLRIVQEAVANARKHAQAENLWVACTVDPPYALVCVEDDGRGFGLRRSPDSHGLAIMKERADRIRARLHVSPRQPRGTRVELQVGTIRHDSTADLGA